MSSVSFNIETPGTALGIGPAEPIPWNTYCQDLLFVLWNKDFWIGFNNKISTFSTCQELGRWGIFSGNMTQINFVPIDIFRPVRMKDMDLPVERSMTDMTFSRSRSYQVSWWQTELESSASTIMPVGTPPAVTWDRRAVPAGLVREQDPQGLGLQTPSFHEYVAEMCISARQRQQNAMRFPNFNSAEPASHSPKAPSCWMKDHLLSFQGNRCMKLHTSFLESKEKV